MVWTLNESKRCLHHGPAREINLMARYLLGHYPDLVTVGSISRLQLLFEPTNEVLHSLLLGLHEASRLIRLDFVIVFEIRLEVFSNESQNLKTYGYDCSIAVSGHIPWPNTLGELCK